MADNASNNPPPHENLQCWLNEWGKDPNPPWKMKGVNPFIKTYQDDLTKGLPCAKIFFPLCGDVEDMSWIADMGHTVVGVEISSVAIENFFKNCKIEYTVSPVDTINGTVYKNKNGSIRIYCGDFFLFGTSIEKDFDGIWDRGSFNTLEDLETREKYVDILKSVMKPDANIILEIVLCENSVDIEEIKKVFGDDFGVTDLGIVEPYAAEYVAFGVKFQLFRICKKTEL